MTDLPMTLRAGLAVQEERLAAVEAATTAEELERVDGFFRDAEVLAADPAFAAVFAPGELERIWAGVRDA